VSDSKESEEGMERFWKLWKATNKPAKTLSEDEMQRREWENEIASANRDPMAKP
jgi:hypothetical protein